MNASGSPDFGVDLAALAPKIAASMLVRFHFHPLDLDALMTQLPVRELRATVEGMLPLHWMCGSIEVCLGHPVRQGIVRAERNDGTFEIIELGRKSA